jgi:hypothetical protein
MHIHDVKKLKKDDEVYFKDQDDPEGSGHYIIDSIEYFRDGRVEIFDIDGRILQCYARDLKWAKK